MEHPPCPASMEHPPCPASMEHPPCPASMEHPPCPASMEHPPCPASMEHPPCPASMEHPAVTNFRNYIRIKTVPPNPDHASCTRFLQEQAKELGVKCEVMEYVPGIPVVVMTLVGQDPSLASLLLNSHTDVVPVFPEHWKYDPFSGDKDDNGDIYGRGTQDMKCVGIQYLEAVKSLRKEGRHFLRTIYISFVPDEETGGVDGMKNFVKSDVFKEMNVGFALDEGHANPTDNFYVFYGERSWLYIKVKCAGQPGHGSQFLTNTAGGKLHKVIDSFLSYRDEQERLLKENKNLRLGDVNTVNLTMLEGGVQYNVVPAELSVGFDVRLTPTQDLTKFEEKIKSFCKAAGEDVTYEIVGNKIPEPSERQNQLTCVEDGKNPWWDAFSQACKHEGVNLEKQILSGGTDIRYLRQVNIPALGFSPINRTPFLPHDHNEFLNETIFLRGIEIYKAIISALANMKI